MRVWEVVGGRGGMAVIFPDLDRRRDVGTGGHVV